MEPISTALAGISLIKASVSFIKENIDTVNDISDIVGSIDNLLNGEQEIQKNRYSNKSMIGQTKDAASSVIDAKLAQEAISEMRKLVDFRFGHGTWQSIINERARRLQEEKEIIEEERKALIRKKAKFQKNLQIFLLSSGVGLFFIIGSMTGVIYLTGGL